MIIQTKGGKKAMNLYKSDEAFLNVSGENIFK